MSVAGRVIVYGGRGALGSTVVNVFKKNQFWVCNIDMQVHLFLKKICFKTCPQIKSTEMVIFIWHNLQCIVIGL